jgi:hypothetical protein
MEQISCSHRRVASQGHQNTQVGIIVSHFRRVFSFALFHFLLGEALLLPFIIVPLPRRASQGSRQPVNKHMSHLCSGGGRPGSEYSTGGGPDISLSLSGILSPKHSTSPQLQEHLSSSPPHHPCSARNVEDESLSCPRFQRTTHLSFRNNYHLKPLDLVCSDRYVASIHLPFRWLKLPYASRPTARSVRCSSGKHRSTQKPKASVKFRRS